MRAVKDNLPTPLEEMKMNQEEGWIVVCARATRGLERLSLAARRPPSSRRVIWNVGGS